MDSITIVTIVFIVGLLVFIIFSLKPIFKKQASNNEQQPSTANKQLQLQAYERLLLLCDRIALPNLITRVNQPGFTATEMQMFMIENIRQEYEYNVTQQMFVSNDAWTAIKNLKEQNIGMINQIAALLAENANGIDLCRVLSEFLLQDKRGRLHEVVSEILSHEAKKVM